MFSVYCILLVVSIIGIKIKLKSFNEDYLSRDSTRAINGFFVILVFCRHFKQYVSFGDNLLDCLFLKADSYLGQLIVVMFLFYSGYGIITRIKASSDGQYIRSFLKHRLVPVWLQFAICICLFLVADTILGKIRDYSWWQIGLSFFGWTSVGNSTWFMFDTFVLYLFVFLSFRFFRFKSLKENLAVFSLLCLGFFAVLYFTKNSTWWNTVLCFPIGMWYGLFNDRIEAILHKQKMYWLLTVSLLCVFGVFWLKYYSGFFYIAVSTLFAFVVILITMKVNIESPVLIFLGKHVFSVYILQRIVFMLFQPIITNLYLFFICSLIITIITAVLFDCAFKKARQIIVSKNVQSCSSKSA